MDDLQRRAFTAAVKQVNSIEPAEEPREIFELFFSGNQLVRGNEKGIILRPLL